MVAHSSSADCRPKPSPLIVSKIYEGGEKSQLETSFVLPERNKPVRLVCKAERVVPSNGNVYVGASFIDADFTNYQNLQQYLV